MVGENIILRRNDGTVTKGRGGEEWFGSKAA